MRRTAVVLPDRIDLCSEDSAAAAVLQVKVPKLLKTYLAIGARIAAPPAWDREFRTIDFLTLLDLNCCRRPRATAFWRR
jgi:putative hemolysin